MTIRTGFKSLDDALGGLEGGQVLLLAGRPGAGTTSLAIHVVMNITLGMAGQEQPVGVFTFDLSADDYIRRALTIIADVPTRCATSGRLTDEQRRRLEAASDTLDQASFFLEDGNYMDLESLRERATKMKERHGIKLLVVDNLQWIRLPHHEHVTEEHDLRIIASGIKHLAGQLGMPIILCCEVGRVADDEAGALGFPPIRIRDVLEKKTDVIALLRRPCHCAEDPESDDKTLAVLDVVKTVRGTGRDIRLHFDEESGRFREASAH